MYTNDTNDQELPEELKAIELALRQLAPLGGSLDRDRLMYLAGLASVARAASKPATARFDPTQYRVGRNRWRWATAALALVSITLGGLVIRDAQRPVQTAFLEQPTQNVNGPAIVESFTPVAAFPSSNSSVNSNADYFQLRNLVLSRGVDALRTTPASNRTVAPASMPVPTLRQEFFGNDS